MIRIISDQKPQKGRINLLITLFIALLSLFLLVRTGNGAESSQPEKSPYILDKFRQKSYYQVETSDF
jgi:hypothetical protein